MGSRATVILLAARPLVARAGGIRPTTMHRLTAAVPRLGWGVADQAVSSLTNVGMGVVVARLVSAEEFGAYAVTFSAYLVALNISRQLASRPVSIRYSGVGEPEWRDATAASTGAALTLAVVMAVIVALVGVALGGTLGRALVALGVTLPGLLLQDAWRLAFFAAGRGRSAFSNDLLWGGVLAVGLGVAGAAHVADMAPIVLLWGVAATAAALAGIRQAGVVPAPGATRSWWRAHRDITPQYAAVELTTMAADQLFVFAAGSLAGLAAAGALRGANLLLGPLNIVVQGVFLVATPGVATSYRRGSPSFAALCVATSVGLVAVAAATVVLVVALPNTVGPLLLGASWTGAAAVFVPAGVRAIADHSASGARLGLSAAGAATRLLVLTAVESLVILAAGLAGLLAGSVILAVTAMAVGTTLMTPVWWLALARTARARSDGESPPTHDEEPKNAFAGARTHATGLDPA